MEMLQEIEDEFNKLTVISEFMFKKDVYSNNNTTDIKAIGELEKLKLRLSELKQACVQIDP